MFPAVMVDALKFQRDLATELPGPFLPATSDPSFPPFDAGLRNNCFVAWGVLISLGLQQMCEKLPIPATNLKPVQLKQIGLGLLLLGATVLAYLPALEGGIIIDDAEHLTAPALRSFAGLWRIWSVVGATHQYFPVLHSAFWLEHRLWGDAVLGYHLTNVLLHAGAACLLVAIMRRLALPGDWLAGFIFALHPVCVESVAWISEQKNTLSTFFGLGSVLVYLHFDETRRRSSYGISLMLFILALLS
jgi:hypothetical protein